MIHSKIIKFFYSDCNGLYYNKVKNLLERELVSLQASTFCPFSELDLTRLHRILKIVCYSVGLLLRLLLVCYSVGLLLLLKLVCYSVGLLLLLLVCYSVGLLLLLLLMLVCYSVGLLLLLLLLLVCCCWSATLLVCYCC
jgi:hypothetical protein